MCCSKHYALYLYEVMEWIFYLDVARWLCGSQWKQVVKSLFYICAQQSEKLIWKLFCSSTLSFVIFLSKGFLILQENYFDEFNRVSSKVGGGGHSKDGSRDDTSPFTLCSPLFPLLCTPKFSPSDGFRLQQQLFLPSRISVQFMQYTCNIYPIYSHAIFPGWIWVQIALLFQHFGSPVPPVPLLPL